MLTALKRGRVVLSSSGRKDRCVASLAPQVMHLLESHFTCSPDFTGNRFYTLSGNAGGCVLAHSSSVLSVSTHCVKCCCELFMGTARHLQDPWGTFCPLNWPAHELRKAYYWCVWQSITKPGSIEASCKARLTSISWIVLHRHSSHTLYMWNDMGKIGAGGEWNMGKCGRQADMGSTSSQLYAHTSLFSKRAQSNVEE